MDTAALCILQHVAEGVSARRICRGKRQPGKCTVCKRTPEPQKFYMDSSTSDYQGVAGPPCSDRTSRLNPIRKRLCRGLDGLELGLLTPATESRLLSFSRSCEAERPVSGKVREGSTRGGGLGAHSTLHERELGASPTRGNSKHYDLIQGVIWNNPFVGEHEPHVSPG